MTDERLEQILKQALAPEIDDSEIRIQRKGRNSKMKMKKLITVGLVACATLALVVVGGLGEKGSKTEKDETDNISGEQNIKSNNMFAITAYAAEVPEGVTSGDVLSPGASAPGVSSSGGALTSSFLTISSQKPASGAGVLISGIEVSTSTLGFST